MALKEINKENDYALILGASSGFGEAVSLELARTGFNIIGVHMDRGPALIRVDELKNQIQEYGVKAMFFNVNAASDKNRQAVLESVIEEFSSDPEQK
ncbi:MAG: SDR family NAD(P)-dependent oxidoreductase, partial [Calditrichaceae bacterium]